jgi:hypothetical protein
MPQRCSPPAAVLDLNLTMENKQRIVCDGCGQLASSEHLARRLQLLEWATRFRPVHINTLLLGAVAPNVDAELFYSPEGAFAGEAAFLAEVAGLAGLDRTREQLHVAFQRGGFFATHVLECPAEPGSSVALAELIAHKLPNAITRIRRSLRPKKVVLISAHLEPFVQQLRSALPDCKIILNGEKAFCLEPGDPSGAIALLRYALTPESVRES